MMGQVKEGRGVGLATMGSMYTTITDVMEGRCRYHYACNISETTILHG